MRISKQIDAEHLRRELAAAGVTAPFGTYRDEETGETILHGYGPDGEVAREDGTPYDLPDGAHAVVNAHDGMPAPPEPPPAVPALAAFKDAIAASGDFTPAQKALLANGFAAVIAALEGRP